MKFRKGFTLIELLVVVAIIGVLATLIVSSLDQARLRAQDAKTKHTVKQVQTALVLYNLDKGMWPSNCSTGGWSRIGANYSGSICLQELIDESYAPVSIFQTTSPIYYHNYSTTPSLNIILLATPLQVREYGPLGAPFWHCSDASGGANDKYWCLGYAL